MTKRIAGQKRSDVIRLALKHGLAAAEKELRRG